MTTLTATQTIPLASFFQQPMLTDWVGPFLLLVLLISVVAGALKQDRPRAIVAEIGKLFLVLTLGFLFFCVSLYLLGNPHAPFQ